MGKMKEIALSFSGKKDDETSASSANSYPTKRLEKPEVMRPDVVFDWQTFNLAFQESKTIYFEQNFDELHIVINGGLYVEVHPGGIVSDGKAINVYLSSEIILPYFSSITVYNPTSTGAPAIVTVATVKNAYVRLGR